MTLFKKGHTPWSKGKRGIIKRSEETRKKISENHADFSGKNHPLYGTHRSNETKDKISKTRKEKGIARGKNNPNYKHGLYPLYDLIRNCDNYLQWKFEVKKKDNFTCVACKSSSGGDLNSHHIKRFKIILVENNIKTLEEALLCKELWDIKNGITLCEKCHIEIHKGEIYGT